MLKINLTWSYLQKYLGEMSQSYSYFLQNLKLHILGLLIQSEPEFSQKELSRVFYGIEYCGQRS